MDADEEATGHPRLVLHIVGKVRFPESCRNIVHRPPTFNVQDGIIRSINGGRRGQEVQHPFVHGVAERLDLPAPEDLDLHLQTHITDLI